MKISTEASSSISIPFENVMVNDECKTHMNMSHLKNWQSTQLFGDAKQVLISHLGERYMLSLTKQKKLLLTKAIAD